MRDALRPDLAARWGRVAEAARGRGADPAAVLSAERLSHLSGVEPARVAAVVAGTAPEVPLERRVHRRFPLLRATRRDKHGRQWPLAATAEDFGAPGASLGPLNTGTGLPRLGHAAGVQRFFGVHPGFLLADDAEALGTAFAGIERELGSAGQGGENPMLAVMRAHDVRGIVTRAGRLSPRGWKSLADHLEDLLAREGQLARLPPPAADAAEAAPAAEAVPAAEADTADAPHGPDREHPR